MNLRQLEVFRAVCEQGGFTRAAQSLYMTQPAVSHVIAELEKEAGCPLFDRISRRIYLTEAGRIFLEKARQILELHEELSAGFPALTGQAPLRIGSGITIANFHLPTILRRCRRLLQRLPAAAGEQRKELLCLRGVKDPLRFFFCIFLLHK